MPSDSEFDIRDLPEVKERSLTEGDTIKQASSWTVATTDAEKIRIDHPSGISVHLTQQKPVGGDLPFKAHRVTPVGNMLRLSESDYFTNIWNAAHCYMVGIEEGRNPPE
jgi:hypothetical protein